MLLWMRFRVYFVRDLLFVIWAYWSVSPLAEGIGVNWGTQATHRLPPETVVRLLRDNGFAKVKLFDADYDTLSALGGSGIEVMVGIPNDMLSSLARRVGAAEKWVSENVSRHISNDVKISCVAVGNEPFLETYNGSFLNATYPALRNIQSALIKAGVGGQVKVTVPLNADVYESPTGVPSGGDFRADIHDLMLSIVTFLSANAGLFTVNIYPFISLYSDPHFPLDYAFFDTRTAPLADGGTLYYNMFDANYDTLVWSLQKNGFPDLPIVVGEIGWPTDGHPAANLVLARRFNQGFISRSSATGATTPVLARRPLDAYLFSLLDEDAKSIAPGYFERHWGLFSFDGIPKYSFALAPSHSAALVPAKSVRYLDRKWCVMSPSASLDDPWVEPSVSYACGRADCTSLGFGTSCATLDARGNISYAFNSYYQIHNQLDHACRFPNISVVTHSDPSVDGCRFEIMIRPYVSCSVALLPSSLLLLLFCLPFSVILPPSRHGC